MFFDGGVKLTNTLLISNVTIVNHDQVPFDGDVFIENGRIKRVGKALTDVANQVIHAKGKEWFLFPGYIAEGFDADFVILDQQLNVEKTICRGKVVFESPKKEKL